ncbi:hypothetical protein BD408DRAFT_415793, partial [Parasitella parasitica]
MDPKPARRDWLWEMCNSQAYTYNRSFLAIVFQVSFTVYGILYMKRFNDIYNIRV